MRSRLPALPPFLASGALVLAGLGVVAAAPPAVSDIIPSTEVTACTTVGPRPCVVSFTVDGGAPPSGLSYYASTYSIDGSKEVSFGVYQDDDADLGFAALADNYRVVIDMGTIVPRVVSGKGQDAAVTRARSGSTYTVTVEGRPVTVSGQCDQSVYPWVCPEDDVVIDDAANFNNIQWDGYFDFQVTNYESYDDSEILASMYGLDYFTNVAATSIPPAIVEDGATGTQYLSIDLANRRFLEDDTTLVQGRAELRIPNAFLRTAYGVPNPELMTGSSLAVTGAGTTTTTSITQEAGDDAMVVLLDGVTFPDLAVPDHTYRGDARAAKSSMKVVRVKRGVITPGKPGISAAKRLAAKQARITFTKAKVRGAKVTGYEVRCTSGPRKASAKGSFPSITVTGLKRGLAYDCRVRARSKAGNGGFSAAKKVARRP